LKWWLAGAIWLVCGVAPNVGILVMIIIHPEPYHAPWRRIALVLSVLHLIFIEWLIRTDQQSRSP
jgi:hypothetical protein